MKITSKKLIKAITPYGLLILYKHLKPRLVEKLKVKKENRESGSGMTGLRFDPSKMKTAEEQILFAKHQFAYDYAKKYAHSVNVSKILDYGTGDGYGADFLAKNLPDVEVYASDIDEESLEDARKKYNRKNLNFVRMNDLEKYDLITSFQVIEHVEDVEEYLRSLKKMLKKDGKLIVSTPDRRYRLTSSQKPWNPYHLREYTKAKLVKDVKKVFPASRVLQLSGDKNMLRIEYSRVAHSRSDKKIYMGVMPEELNKTYSTKDFYLSEKDTVDSLDLFAIIDNKTKK